MSDLDLESSFREVREFAARIGQLCLRSLKRWQIWTAALPLAGAVAWYLPKQMPPIYDSQTVLMYRQTLQTESLLGPQEKRETWQQMSRRFIDVADSRTSMEDVIHKFNLYPGTVSRQGMVSAVEELRRHVEFAAPLGGATLVIGFRGESPALVRQVTEYFADRFKEQPGRDAAAQAEATRRFLEAQLQIVTQGLEAKEKELAAFSARHPEFTAEPGAADRPGAGLRAATARAVAPRSFAAPGSHVATTSAPAPGRAQPNARAQAAEQAIADATARLTTLRAQYTDAHPAVLAAAERLRAARADLADAHAAADALPAEQEVRPPETSERSASNAPRRPLVVAFAPPPPAVSEKSFESLVDDETSWVALNRQVRSARTQHEEVERRLFQAATLAKVESSGGQGELVTTDPAYTPPRPLSRGTRRMALTGFAAVLVLALLGSFAYTLLDGRIYDEYELRSLKIGEIVHALPPCPSAGEMKSSG